MKQAQIRWIDPAFRTQAFPRGYLVLSHLTKLLILCYFWCLKILPSDSPSFFFKATPFPNSFKCFTCENAGDNYNCNRWAEDKWCPQGEYASLEDSSGFSVSSLSLGLFLNWKRQLTVPMAHWRSVGVLGFLGKDYPNNRSSRENLKMADAASTCSCLHHEENFLKGI